MSAETFMRECLGILQTIEKTQADRIREAAGLAADSIRGGGMIHAFGTGHSHMLAEDIYSRAGGLVPVNALLEPALMLHVDPVASGAWERVPGVAEVLLNHSEVRPGDTLIVISNSGRNAVPVEAARWGREHGCKVVAVTSLAHSKSVPPLDPPGQRLFEVADVVLDNSGVPGDALVEIPGADVRVAATSTIAGAFLLQAMAAETARLLAEAGETLPVLKSFNTEGAEEHNQKLMLEYKGRLPVHYDRVRQRLRQEGDEAGRGGDPGGAGGAGGAGDPEGAGGGQGR